MSLFVLADLHLCKGAPEKTMSIFNGWENYQERIEKNWLELINNDDTVVLPGDISWGMSLAEALPDFHFINHLPGILSRPDTRIRSILPFLQYIFWSEHRSLHLPARSVSVPLPQ